MSIKKNCGVLVALFCLGTLGVAQTSIAQTSPLFFLLFGEHKVGGPR